MENSVDHSRMLIVHMTKPHLVKINQKNTACLAESVLHYIVLYEK